MRKLLLFLFIIVSLQGLSQAKIAADGSLEPTGNFPALKDQHLKGGMRTVVDTAARNAIPASFRNNGMLVQTITPFTLWRLDSTSAPVWKPFVSATTSLSWDSVFGKPSNFTTTYALLNDGKDSIDSKVSLNTAQTITGIKEFSKTLSIKSVTSGGAIIKYDGAPTGGNKWEAGTWSSSNDVSDAFGFYNETANTTPMILRSGELRLRNALLLNWAYDDAGYADSGLPNAGLAWDAANRLQINNGTANSYADLKLRTLISTTLAGTGTRMVVTDANGQLSSQAIPELSGYVPTTRTINGYALSSNVSLSKTDIGLGNVPNTDATNPANISQSASYRFVTDTEKSTWNAKQNALGFTPENIANKGQANGYADLDANGKVPASRIDFTQTGQTFVVASQSAMLAVSGANVGAMAIRTDQSRTYVLIATPASTLGNWVQLLSPDAPVQSVNGQTGNVNLLTTNIGEGANLYYTDARARAALSAGTGISYNSTTGAISSTITQYTDALARAAFSITGGSAAYNSGTGVFSIPTNTNHISEGSNLYFTNARAISALTGQNISIFTNNSGFITATTNALTNYYTITQSDARFAQLTGATFTGQVNGTVVALSGAAYYRVTNATNTTAFDIGLLGGSGDATAYIYQRHNADIVFATNSVERLRISASGSVSIGSNDFTARSVNLADGYGINAGNFQIGGISSNRFYIYNTTLGIDNIVITPSTGITQFNRGITGTTASFNSTISTTGEIKSISGSTSVLRMIASGTATYIQSGATETANSSAPLYFTTYFGGDFLFGIESTKVYSYKNFGAGTNNPAYPAHVVRSNAGVGLQVENSTTYAHVRLQSAGTNQPTYLTFNPTGTGNAIIQVNDVDRIYIASGGATTFVGGLTAPSYTESSDIRQKLVHITLISADGIDAIHYTFKPDGQLKWGYSAQQVQKVLPMAVHEGIDGFLKLDYTTVHTYKIAQLEKRVADLEKKVGITDWLTTKVMTMQIQLNELSMNQKSNRK